MSAPWGPGLDAEVAYRHELVRTQIGRRSRRTWFRRPPRAATPRPVVRPAAA